MPTSQIQKHYDALSRGELLAHRCDKCRTLTFPATTACENCGGFAFTEVKLSGKGTLFYASHNMAPATHPRFADYAPYVYGHVILEEGVVTQGIINNVEATPEAMAKLYTRTPVPVVLEVLKTSDLPVIAFKLA